jgi:hypothetical protein
MVEDLIFYSGIACLLIHELDAIQQHEWRFFFALSSINDKRAYHIFVALHLPLFVLIFWYLPSSTFQIGFDIFLMIHAGLHGLLRNHPLITFNNGFSRLWIWGGAVLGAIHLGLG